MTDAEPAEPPKDASREPARAVLRLPVRKASAISRWWLLLFPLVLVEVVGHMVIRARVPSDASWRAAAAYLAAEKRDHDLVVMAPAWADPLLRLWHGDRMGFAEAGPSDLEGFDRMWVVSIRGARAADEPRRAPDGVELFGNILVKRWDLGASTQVFDFTAHAQEAEVFMVQGDQPQPCPWRDFGTASGGGLGAGAMTPVTRAACDPHRPWLWVGRTVTEDLDLLPRDCVWQHPAGDEPIRVIYRDVPLGDRIVFYGGIYYEHERKLEGGPINARILVDGAEVGRMTHRDGDGWKRIESLTRPPADASTAPEQRGDIAFEVTASVPHLRTFCWSAAVHRGRREMP